MYDLHLEVYVRVTVLVCLMMLHTSSGACRSESSTMVLQPVSQTILHTSLTVFSSGTWVTMKALHCLYPCNRHHVTVIATPEQTEQWYRNGCACDHMIVGFFLSSAAFQSEPSLFCSSVQLHTLSLSLCLVNFQVCFVELTLIQLALMQSDPGRPVTLRHTLWKSSVAQCSWAHTHMKTHRDKMHTDIHIQTPKKAPHTHIHPLAPPTHTYTHHTQHTEVQHTHAGIPHTQIINIHK